MVKIILKCISVVAVLLAANAALAQDKVPLKTQLPKPLFVGTPVPLNVPNLEPPLKGKRPDFMVPAGTVNLAKGKKVTASDDSPVVGTLDLVNDGDKAGDEGSVGARERVTRRAFVTLGKQERVRHVYQLGLTLTGQFPL